MNLKLVLSLAVVWVGAILFVQLRDIHGASATGAWTVAIIWTFGLCNILAKPNHKRHDNNSPDD